jgi:hypothetical protein
MMRASTLAFSLVYLAWEEHDERSRVRDGPCPRPDALVELLARKGVITKRELLAEI